MFLGQYYIYVGSNRGEMDFLDIGVREEREREKGSWEREREREREKKVLKKNIIILKINKYYIR